MLEPHRLAGMAPVCICLCSLVQAPQQTSLVCAVLSSTGIAYHSKFCRAMAFYGRVCG